MTAKEMEGSGAGGQGLGGVVAPNPARGKRVVVSVSLARGDFDRIAGTARARGQTVSEFIKHSSLEAAPEGGASAEIVGATGSTFAVLVLRQDAHSAFGQTYLHPAPEVTQEPPLTTVTLA